MRKPNRRIPTDEVQGEGSYFVLRPYLWGEFESLQKQRDAGTLDQDEHTRHVLALQIADWNWTDGEDQPLPLPKNDLTVFDRLTGEEMIFLMDSVNAVRQEEREAAKSRRGEPAVGALDRQGASAA